MRVERDTIRTEIQRKLRSVRALLPAEVPVPLVPKPELAGEREWHPLEHNIWEISEQIRQLLSKAPSLRGDPELTRQFLAISRDRRAGRGRQSFIMLLGFKSCRGLAADLFTEVADGEVAGQVVWALYRMKVRGFASTVQRLCAHERTWIRKEAQRYGKWDSDGV